MQYFLTNTETSVTYDTGCPFPDEQINFLHDYECLKKTSNVKNYFADCFFLFFFTFMMLFYLVAIQKYTRASMG